jgi:hypothetical protein
VARDLRTYIYAPRRQEPSGGVNRVDWYDA